MIERLELNKELIKLLEDSEKDLQEEFAKIDRIAELNSLKVLTAFQNNKVSVTDFFETTGYGYNDVGRDKIDKIFAEVLGAEDALVRNQFISGTHAISTTFFGLLRPNDILLSITGKPYDTLDEVIGFRENASSLEAHGISYQQIDLVDNDFDYEKIERVITKLKIKVILIQRSKGYSNRKSISLKQLEKVIKFIKKIDEDIIVMIDNCYTEFVEEKSPLEVGADIIVGSLIKNLGGGIAPNGAYVAGKKGLVELVAERLTVPGLGKEVGPTLGINKLFLQGLYFAPRVIASSLKTVVLASYLLERLGYQVEPKYNEERCDIVESIIFNDKDKMMDFCQSIQSNSAIDSYLKIEPTDMPGYDDQIIMASGSFIQGSSIELSADAPLREPYTLYLQGGLTYEYGKIAIIKAINKIIEKN